MKYNSASKKNEVLTHTTTWINPEDIMLSKKKRERQKRTNILWSPFHEIPREATFIEPESRVVLPGAGGNEWALIFSEFLFGKMKKLWRWIVVMVVPYWECTWCHWTVLFSSVQSHSHVWLFATPWTAARQASLSITNSRSLPKLMSTESVMPSNHLILCRPLLLPSIFPSIRVFSNESALLSGGQSAGASALTSVLPVNTQDWSPLGWTGWISLQSRGLSRVFSITTVQKHQFFSTHLSLQSNSNT